MPDGLNEIYREGALISGSVLAGVMVRDPGTAGTRLGGYVPEDWSDAKLCARVTSIDGLYEGTAVYTVPTGWTGGIAPFEFPTRYGELLRDAKDDTLAVRVTRDGCDEAAEGEVSVALWNARDIGAVDLLVNSFRADAIFLYVGGAATPLRCSAIEQGGRTAFDTKCTVTLDGLSGRVPIELYRVVDGKPAAPDLLTLRLPEG